MKNTIAIVAIAGFAAAASAQDFSLSISGPTVVAAGDTFTIEVSGDSSFGTHMLGGGFSLTSDSGLIDNMSWTPGAWSAFNEDNDGYLGNGNYGGVVFGQLLLPIPGFDVPAAGSELGGVIGSFEVTVGANGGVIDFALNAASPFTLEAVDTANGLATASSANGALTLNGLSVTVTPAPSAMALLGLGGLVAGRRRR